MMICLEGIDGVGKSTQCRLLAERLKGKLWKFPNVTGGSPTGKLIYEHLKKEWWLDSKREPAQLAVDEALIFQALQVANRMEVANQILDDASRGHVVFDRYWPSSYAYGSADGLDGEYLQRLHRWLPQPDLFILLDGDPALLGERRPGEGDRYEADQQYLQRVARFYRQLWKQGSTPRWQMVDASQSLEAVTASIMGVVAVARAEFGLGQA
jgi:dTMP kinase